MGNRFNDKPPQGGFFLAGFYNLPGMDALMNAKKQVVAKGQHLFFYSPCGLVSQLKDERRCRYAQP